MSPVPRRIAWRCRRGTRELDLVLEGFLNQGYDGLGMDERELFEEMLELQDTSLIEWLLYRHPPDHRYAELVAQILRYHPDNTT